MASPKPTKTRKERIAKLIQLGATPSESSKYAHRPTYIKSFKKYKRNKAKLLKQGIPENLSTWLAQSYSDPSAAYMKYLEKVESLKDIGATKGDAEYFARNYTQCKERYLDYVARKKEMDSLTVEEGTKNYFARQFENPTSAYATRQTSLELLRQLGATDAHLFIRLYKNEAVKMYLEERPKDVLANLWNINELGQALSLETIEQRIGNPALAKTAITLLQNYLEEVKGGYKIKTDFSKA